MAKNGPLKYHGGKSYLSKWIQDVAPPSVKLDPKSGYTHRAHPYAGGLGELWSWPYEGVSEAVNDTYEELTNFYDVLRDKAAFKEFHKIVCLTPFSELEFNKHRGSTDVMRAVTFFVRNRLSRQGRGESYATPTTRTRRGMNENVSAYLSAVDTLPQFHDRLRRVEIRSLPALDFIERYDHKRVLFYCDPPYMPECRADTDAYGEHEMSKADHLALLKTLAKIKGRFILSGYPTPMYAQHAKLNGWYVRTLKIDNKASSAKTKRVQTECVWTNFEPSA